MIEKAKIRNLPIWVTLPNFPIHLWNKEVFAGVGSVLGRPIRLDAHTAAATNKEAARMLIMMEADGEFPEVVPIFMQNDEGLETEEQIRIDYWKAPFRSNSREIEENQEAIGPQIKNQPGIKVERS